MIDAEQFALIARKHGGYASWAIWTDASAAPKSNIEDLSRFANPQTLALLKNDVIMVGLNISRSFAEQFRNFHDPHRSANDFKIRHAFTNTEYYGAYMTDVIKDTAMVSSAQLLGHLKAVPSIVHKSIELFREELRDLRSQKPTILAFGRATHALIAGNLSLTEYSRLIRLTHYSCRMSKERYRERVLAEIRWHD